MIILTKCFKVERCLSHSSTSYIKKKKKKVLHWTGKRNWIKATEIMAFVQLQRYFPQRNMEIQRNNKMFSTVCVFAVH